MVGLEVVCVVDNKLDCLIVFLWLLFVVDVF